MTHNIQNLAKRYSEIRDRHPVLLPMAETVVVGLLAAAVNALASRSSKSPNMACSDEVEPAKSETDEPRREMWISGAGMFDNREDAIQSHIDIYGKGW
ncbi:hypothetical protein [Cupriavidus sp. U2]|uniref:hypothetical protein n=1 Tax=Cupriavidus sp. U2 TaxID=2920269 RepID=UPI00129D5016|nr:hypothetical protein [Cupriavidus sp. U2]